MAKIIEKGDGVPCQCTGNMGHGGAGCGAIVGVYDEDLFNVSSLADPSDRNQAFRCPQCGVTSDFEFNRMVKTADGKYKPAR